MSEAIKFKVIEEQKLEFKDGDDGGGGELLSADKIVIKRVDNGWILTIMYKDEDPIVEVYNELGKDMAGPGGLLVAVVEELCLEDEFAILALDEASIDD